MTPDDIAFALRVMTDGARLEQEVLLLVMVELKRLYTIELAARTYHRAVKEPNGILAAEAALFAALEAK